VIDRKSRQVLAASNADALHAAASLTKLVAADVLLSRHIPLTAISSIHTEDAVEGAMLYVEDGEEFTVDALLYATLVASANNAANALARAAGLTKSLFVDEMNLRAAVLNLTRTRFVDPSGIDPTNVTTAREAARFAEAAFARSEVRRYTSTAQVAIPMLTSGGAKKLKSTNWMLYYPEYEDIFIMSGKTGYLDESGWNLVVSIRPKISDTDRELLIVTFGSASRADSFKDTRALAEWAWTSHTWKPNK
jgi:D-alanyl-D-alanine endopeptidase (penicillin-binding protein 7)